RWCNIAVSLLWRRPFTEYVVPFNDDTVETRAKITCIEFRSYQEPMFSYAKYLQELSDVSIIKSVRFYAMYQAHQFSFQNTYNPIIDALWHMFMRQCTKINSLSITILSPINSPTGIMNVNNIMEAKLALSHLRNFSLVISHNENDYWKIQELLNKLLLNVDCYSTNIITAPMQALKSQVDWLTSLIFEYVHFDINSVTILSTMINLDSLQLKKYSWPNVIIPTIFERTGDTLNHLVIDHVSIYVIQIAKEYCLNIKTLYIQIGVENFEYIFPWIKKLKLEKFNLKFLLTGRSRRITLSIEETSKVLQHLGQSIPLTLTYLRLDGIKISKKII
ncbi:13341_t:CDS:2, partial [Dentiscutata erythropus]